MEPRAEAKEPSDTVGRPPAESAEYRLGYEQAFEGGPMERDPKDGEKAWSGRQLEAYRDGYCDGRRDRTFRFRWVRSEDGGATVTMAWDGDEGVESDELVVDDLEMLSETMADIIRKDGGMTGEYREPASRGPFPSSSPSISASPSNPMGSAMELHPQPNASALTPAAVPANLEDTWTAQVRSLNDDDAMAAGAFFTDDCSVMVGPKLFHGREDLLQRWLSVYLKVVTDVTVTPLHFADLGDVIVEKGTYSYHAGETRRGVYEQTWVKSGSGSWAIRSMLACGISGYY